MKKKILITTAVFTTLFIMGGFYFFNKNSSEDQPAAVNPTEEGVNLSPPTENDKAENDAHKESLGNSNETAGQATNSNGLKEVKPLIVYSGQQDGKIEVSARVPEVFEKSGTCTLTLKNGSKTIDQSKKAIQNVSEMSCGLIQIDKTRVSAGNWKATISYSSDKARGTSDSVSINVK